MPWGILAWLRSWEKMPLASWPAKLLVLLEGVMTARVFLAQARALAPLGFSSPPCHLLQPWQRTSSCQWLVLEVVVGRTVYLAPVYAPGRLFPLFGVGVSFDGWDHGGW